MKQHFASTELCKQILCVGHVKASLPLQIWVILEKTGETTFCLIRWFTAIMKTHGHWNTQCIYSTMIFVLIQKYVMKMESNVEKSVTNLNLSFASSFNSWQFIICTFCIKVKYIFCMSICCFLSHFHIKRE